MIPFPNLETIDQQLSQNHKPFGLEQYLKEGLEKVNMQAQELGSQPQNIDNLLNHNNKQQLQKNNKTQTKTKSKSKTKDINTKSQTKQTTDQKVSKAGAPLKPLFQSEIEKQHKTVNTQQYTIFGQAWSQFTNKLKLHKAIDQQLVGKKKKIQDAFLRLQKIYQFCSKYQQSIMEKYHQYLNKYNKQQKLLTFKDIVFFFYIQSKHFNVQLLNEFNMLITFAFKSIISMENSDQQADMLKKFFQSQNNRFLSYQNIKKKGSVRKNKTKQIAKNQKKQPVNNRRPVLLTNQLMKQQCKNLFLEAQKICKTFIDEPYPYLRQCMARQNGHIQTAKLFPIPKMPS